MKKINILLEKNKTKFKGTLLNEVDVQLLKDRIDVDLILFWSKIIVNYQIVGTTISFFDDKSGVEEELQIMTPKDTIDECFDFYPGIEAIKEGYIPIGQCMMGSGDPYFIKEKDGKVCLYRIIHDFNIENGKLDPSGIEFIDVFSNFLERGI